MEAGVPLDAVLDLGVHLAAAVDEIALRYVDVVDRHVVGWLRDPVADLQRLTDLLTRLRPLARKVVDTELEVAMERRVRTVLGGRLAELRAQRQAG